MSSRKQNVLLISDAITSPSGVGTMSKHIVYNTVDKINWLQIGQQNFVGKNNPIQDLSEQVIRETGVMSASVRMMLYDTFGDINILRQLLRTEKIDAIVIFTDPRYFEWIFQYEIEIRSKVPVIYYNIWDNEPTPLYNKAIYESVDSLIAISRLTESINHEVLRNSDVETSIDYIPHGVDQKVFFPIEPNSVESLIVDGLREKFAKDAEFILFWNNRNLPRKCALDVIAGFVYFLKNSSLPTSNYAKLIMHTNPKDSDGPNLLQYIAHNVPEQYKKCISFSTSIISQGELNAFYNLADLTVSLSNQEGWGLSLTESIMAGTPVIATQTGGMVDQMGLKLPKLNGEAYTRSNMPGSWAYPIVPDVRTLKGNIVSSYIYEDIVDSTTFGVTLMAIFADRGNLKSQGLEGRKFLIENNMTSYAMASDICECILDTIVTFEPISPYKIIKL